MAPPKAISVGVEVQEGKQIVTTLAVHSKHITAWVGRQRHVLREAKNLNDKLTGAIAAYSYAGKDNAHTLSICVDNKVLVIDLERQHYLPNKLRDLLNNTQLYANGAESVTEKLRFLGYNFDIMEANLDDITRIPGFNPNEKEGEVSVTSLTAAAKETVTIYEHFL